jgi:hypothetical protein
MRLPCGLAIYSILLTACSDGAAATANTPSAVGRAGASAGAYAAAGAPAPAGAGAGAGSRPVAGSAGAGTGTGGAVAGSAGAGAGGGGAAGAAGSAPPSAGSPACADADFCDSFETGMDMLDPVRWVVVSPNCSGDGRAEVDATQAHSGMRSLRVSGSGGYCNHVFAAAMADLPEAAPLYARLFVRFEHPLAAGHVTFVALRDESEGKDLRMGGQSEILMWNRESDDATLPELSPAGIALSVKPQVGRWHCIEFMIDRGLRRLATWIDGAAVAGLQVEGEPTPDVDAQWLRKTDWMPAPSDARFGWESYGGEANTLWFDDIALGASRFGCAPP